ncbi:MAG: DUF4492 domain-containing protein [Bacteroidaceae bacterium]|jgi:hypothetical protein|nr:DUF4492 domain-containing protein [Bacteroidaceae bacterium]
MDSLQNILNNNCALQGSNPRKWQLVLQPVATFFHRTFLLYYEGFRNMKLGRTLWVIILIKLFIIFAILKVFFFPNFLKQHSPQGKEAEYVATELIERQAP